MTLSSFALLFCVQPAVEDEISSNKITSGVSGIQGALYLAVACVSGS